MARGIPRRTLEMLAEVPLFAACSKQELRLIAQLGTPLTVDDGTELTRQGQPGREFFLVIGGRARCMIDGVKAGQFTAGDFFGEMALLDRGPRVATVIADGAMEVLVLDRREFESLLDDAPSIAKKLLIALAARWRADALLTH